MIHISLVEAIRISENNIKTSKCWFRVGVTDSAWGSSPTTGSRLSAETEGLLSSAPTAGDKIVEEQNVYKAKSKDSSQLETDSGLDSPAASIAELNMEKTNNGEEEVDDFLVLQYIDNSVARFIVDRDDDWVDARVVRICLIIITSGTIMINIVSSRCRLTQRTHIWYIQIL